MLYAELRDDDGLLALVEDAVCDGPLAAAIGEVGRALTIATRRLQLAAADRGVPLILFRRWRKLVRELFDEPSAKLTRWRVRCAPSASLRVAGGQIDRRSNRPLLNRSHAAICRGRVLSPHGERRQVVG